MLRLEEKADFTSHGGEKAATMVAPGHLLWPEAVLGDIPSDSDEFGFLDVSPMSFSAMF